MKQLGLMIAAANHFQPTRLTVPLWLASAATPFTALYYRLVDKEPLYTKIALETIESNSDFDNSKAVRDLDFHPRLMQETVTDTVAFLQSIFRIDQNRILARPALRTRKVSPQEKPVPEAAHKPLFSPRTQPAASRSPRRPAAGCFLFSIL